MVGHVETRHLILPSEMERALYETHHIVNDTTCSCGAAATRCLYLRLGITLSRARKLAQRAQIASRADRMKLEHEREARDAADREVRALLNDVAQVKKHNGELTRHVETLEERADGRHREGQDDMRRAVGEFLWRMGPGTQQIADAVMRLPFVRRRRGTPAP